MCKFIDTLFQRAKQYYKNNWKISIAVVIMLTTNPY